MNAVRSPIDEARFGIRIARTHLDEPAALSEVLNWCADESIAMLIARCSVESITAVHALERHGARLMDTLIYFARDLDAASAVHVADGVTLRPADDADAPGVETAARAAFTHYHGHYHADPRLDPALCDEGYVEWAVKACRAPTPDAVMLVTIMDGQIAGFATVRLNTPDEGEGVLFGVAPGFQGRGLYRMLLTGAIAWCVERGAATMLYSTQITNIAAQTMMARLGFAFHHASYTFHLWLDEKETP